MTAALRDDTARAELSLRVLLAEGSALADPPNDLAEMARIFRGAVALLEDRAIDGPRRAAAAL